MADHRDLLIGGVARPAAEGETFAVHNPHDGSVVASVAKGGVADVDAALTCATRAFDEGPWPRMPAVERGRVLLGAAALLRERAEQFVACDVANAGKPVASARWEVEATASTFEYYGGAANKVHGEVPAGGQARPGRRPAGAGGRLRPDRAVELPADDRRVEGGAGAGLREHRRAQARQLHAAVGAAAG